MEKIVSDGLEFRYQTDTWRVIGELAFGWLTPERGDRIHQVGWHIQPSYYFENGLTPYVRLERVDPNTAVANDHGYDLIVGLNYEIAGGFMIKAENNEAEMLGKNFLSFMGDEGEVVNDNGSSNDLPSLVKLGTSDCVGSA